eukprot:TRINITY_DN2709_c0_g2_i1.p1 TRINITY_DN2709_c0_g2~~TRINITY_DN2709_c0_g2_i1.p1  ORF type:complete len:232 (+),score=66.89 TRINITY_DN2709_c0_g2_i1:47-697(+)
MADASPRRDLLYKILVVGEIGCGKTSIIKRYVHATFSKHYKSTIGVDFALKVLEWDPRTTVRLQLWDIAGQERFGNMTRVYYREAVGAFVVFDVTRMNTFEPVKKWKNDIDSKVNIPGTTIPIPVILLANKIDLTSDKDGGWGKTNEEMDKFCQENGFAGWFATSAKEDVNIDNAAHELVKVIMEKVTVTEIEDNPDTIKLGNNPKPSEDDPPCSC